MKSFTATVFTVLFALPLLYRMDGAAADSTSCAGSIRCGGLAQSDCDAAMPRIVAETIYHTGGTKADSGVCSGHCGLFVSGAVSGAVCSLTGQQMIDAFQNLRNNAGCQKCGIYTFSNGCQFKADYVSSC